MPELPHGPEAQTRRLLRLLLIRRQALPIGSRGKDFRFGCAVWELNATYKDIVNQMREEEILRAKIEAPVAQSQSEKLPPPKPPITVRSTVMASEEANGPGREPLKRPNSGNANQAVRPKAISPLS